MRMAPSGSPVRGRRSAGGSLPGGKVLEVVDTGQPCYACMLGGDDGRTLFMLTAPPANAIDRAGPPAGKLLVAEVEAPHAGLP